MNTAMQTTGDAAADMATGTVEALLAQIAGALEARSNGEPGDAAEAAEAVLEDLLAEEAAQLGRAAKVVRIMSKATKNRPATRVVGEWAIVVPGKSVRLVGLRWGSVAGRSARVGYDQTFAVGDVAEYDSYNKSYFSTITAIGAETVSFGEEKTRLHLSTFSWRNKGNQAQKFAANAAWTD